MRTRSLVWGIVCVLCVAGGWLFWHRGSHSPVRNRIITPTAISTRSLSTAPLISTGKTGSGHATNSNTGLINTNKFAYRLSNTTRSIGQLVGDNHAILLENALIDTANPLNLSIPADLRAAGDPGTYIVQARGPINHAFRAMLAQSGATIVAYLPNDAYLVRATASVAGLLGANPQTQAVLPYEPYYKVQSSLLNYTQGSLPKGLVLNLGLFADDAPSTIQQIEKLGGQIFARDRSPFGPIVRVQLPSSLAANWTALARLTGVQIVEPYFKRAVANDLARVTVGVSIDTVTPTNYLNLTGSNIIVEMNDTGVDAQHPDFTQNGNAQSGPSGPTRVLGDAPQSLLDTDGHGTHVAGIIAGNGAKSLGNGDSPAVNVGAVARGSVTNADFRGKAPQAILYSVGGIEGGLDTNLVSDMYFQEVPALTNALISNNSWGFPGDDSYDLSAASYDAAVRDALPSVTGSQPVLFVFAAGNSGGGNDNGSGGDPDTILSPGTAKNVITVGATEQLRNINDVVTNLAGQPITPWKEQTDTGFQVAGYSGRGNVGVGVEGQFGRYKPDVVAPGNFVVSTRSEQWDTNAYYNPTNITEQAFTDQIVTTNAANYYLIDLSTTPNAVGVTLQVLPNLFSPSPLNLPIYVATTPDPNIYPDPANPGTYFQKANIVTIPPDGPAGYLAAATASGGFNFAVGDSGSQPINYDLVSEVFTTNDLGDYFDVLRTNLNDPIGPWYRYETGTSMATPSVSGTLALMQEFYANAYGGRPSPALLKAMLINGSRATGGYNFWVRNSINFQGWGMINLPDILQSGLTNQLGATCSAFVQDQSSTNALATGDSQTFYVSVTSPNAQVQPLRITLAWTDPPGDPAAAVKLVNNLVLVVTNLDTGTIYYGNDIAAGNTFNTPETTNAPPNIDSINNVQNVYISPLNGTNFSVTVLGYRVNVNAVTAHPNNVVQDYALVVSSGDGAVSNAMTVSATSPASAAPPVTGSNPTGDQQISYISANNAAQLNQFVGANTPLLGTNTVVFSTTAPEGFGPNNWQVTVGMTNQWHFYVVTNSLELSNAAFVTFIPDTLSIPRMGVFADSQANATTLEADIDLYVTTDPSITNLDPAAISNCVVGTQVGAAPGPSFAGASLGRGGTELVVDTNSQSRAPNVYYIGVKSERQVAAEYGFISIFSAEPFSQMDTNGNETVIGHPVPVEIPGGSPALPGFTNVFAFAIYPIQARAVIVTNELYAEDLGDLVGSIYHSGLSVILNNHTLPVNGPGFYSAIYDDSGQGGFPGSIHSAGPGSLHDFIGKDGSGVWVLHESDNATGFSNSVENLTAIIQPHVNSALGTEAFAVPAGGWFYDFVDVPPGATSMTVTATNTPPLANPPLELFVKLGSAPTTNSFDAMTVINNPGPGGTEWGTVTLGPPLASGRYFIGIFNPSATTANGAFFTTIVRPFAPAQTIYNSPDAPIPILDDAVTTDSINVADHQFISSMDVAISVQHPRISDLVFHLISPDGTRGLLMENRGGTDPNGAGGVASIVTVTNINSTFENAPATNYTFGQPVDGWDVIGNQVSVVTDPTNAYQGTNFLALANGTISATLATVPGQTYTLNFAYRGPGIVGWWRGESNAVAVDYAYQNNGALVGGVSYTTGKVDQAFLFSGTGSPYTSRINVPDSPSYILTNGLTIEGWVWASNYVASGQGGIILFRGDDRLGLDPYWMEIDHGTQNLSFSILQFNGTGLTTLNYNFAPWLQQWVHLAGTWDGHSGLMNLYVNGTIVAQAVSPYVPIGALTGPNPGIGIGNNQSTGYNTPWVGSLDEVSLYGRALSASEIKAIYTDGINGNPAGGNGKFDPNRFQLSPRQSLAEAQISVNGSVLTNFFGDNTTWQTYTVSFTASNSITPLQIQGVEPGILLDNIGVVSVQTNYSYLVFTENTNLTTTPIKFAIPPFSAVSTNSANNSVTVWHNSFENFPTVYNLYSAGSYFCGGWHVDSGDIEVVTNGGWYGSTPYGTNNYFMDLNGSQAGTISTNIATSSGQTYILSFAYARNPNSIGAPVPPTVQVLINNNPLGTVADNRMNSWGNLGWQTTSFVFTATAPVTTLTFQSLVGSASGMFLDAVALATPISPYYLPEQPLDTFDGLNAQGAWTLEVQDDRVGATNPAPQLLNWQLRFTYVTTGTNAAGIPPGTTATNIIPANGWAYYPVNVPPSADWATNILVFATGPLNMWFNPTNNPVAGPADSELAAGVISDTAPLSLTSSPTNIVPGTTYYIGLFNPNTFPVTNGFQVNFHLIPPPISLTNGVPITNTFSASLGISVTGHSLVTYDVTVPPNVDFVTNTLISATLPVNLWFNQNVTPNGTYPPNYELLSNSTGGSFVLSATSIPQLAPGLTYHLALENTNGVPVTTAFIVHFHFMSTNPITGPGITMTNVGGTNGFLVQWSGPTNYDYSIQWKTNLAPVFPWNTISNPVINVTYIPPNGNYSWFDDGSQTGGWPPQKFYRVTATLPPTVLTNSTPFTNGVPVGALDQFEVSVPTNATAATNLLISASGPVDVYFNQTGPPNGNNPGSYVMLSNVTSGSFTLTGGTLPPLVPGATYNIGIKNLGSGQVTFVYQVNFGYSALATNPPPTPSIAVTNIGGTNAILLQWVAPTNYQFQVQWTRNLASPITWHTISNVVVTWSGVVSPTNSTYGIFQFLDDGSLTGGLGVRRFYRLIEYPYSAPIPQALTIVNTAILGSAVQFQWMAPTNYQYQVLWTTNLALPLGSWSVLANPVLGLSNGVYIFTDTNQTGPSTSPKFFRVLEQ